LVKDVKKSRLCLYSGKQIDELVACGLKVTPIALGLEDCRSYLEKLG